MFQVQIPQLYPNLALRHNLSGKTRDSVFTPAPFVTVLPTNVCTFLWGQRTGVVSSQRVYIQAGDIFNTMKLKIDDPCESDLLDISQGLDLCKA